MQLSMFGMGRMGAGKCSVLGRPPLGCVRYSFGSCAFQFGGHEQKAAALKADS
jgi:hypothetical protein